MDRRLVLPYPGSDPALQDYDERFKFVRGDGWGSVSRYVISRFCRAGFTLRRFRLSLRARLDIARSVNRPVSRAG
jgi:hypothetical protein